MTGTKGVLDQGTTSRGAPSGARGELRVSADNDLRTIDVLRGGHQLDIPAQAGGVVRPRRYAIIGSRGYPSTYGGFETFVRRFAPYLADQGVDVTVYGRDDSRPEPFVTEDGVRVVNTRGHDSKCASTLSYGLTACRHAARERYDAALVLNCANGYFLPLLRSAGVPTAVNVDGLEWERDKWSSLGKKVFRNSAVVTSKYADRLISDAHGIADYWQEHFNSSSTVIPYGGDVLDELPTTKVREQGLEPGTYILVVARLVPENNVDLLLDAVEKLNGRYRTVVVGSAVGDAPIEQRLREMQRTSNVLWLGHVSDQQLLQQLWQHCGVYVHGHSVGGTNPALLQALGAGSPTVAFDTVFNREVVREACPTYRKDAGELAQLLVRVMEDDMQRRRLSAAGQEIIRQRYTWEQVCADYLEVLDDLAGMHSWSTSRVYRSAQRVRRLAPVAGR